MHHLFQLLQAVSTDGSLMIHEFIDSSASLEEITNHLRRGKVFVHRIVALLTEFCHHLLGLSVTLSRSLYALQIVDGVQQFLQTTLRCYQCLVREIHRTTIVGRQDEETDGHGRIGFLQQRMITRKELLQGNEVIV